MHHTQDGAPASQSGYSDRKIQEAEIRLRGEDVLKATKIGIWVIEADTNIGVKRMYVDQSMEDILGLEHTSDSEEYFARWYQRINDGYYYYVNTAFNEMTSTGKIVEVEYTWKHPSRGEVPVRCVGVLGHVEDGVYTLEGYQRIVEDIVKKSFLDNRNMEIFEYNETRHSIYFHTDRALIKDGPHRERDFPDCWIRQKMIHPYFVEAFQDILSSVKDRQENQNLDLLLKNRQDDFEWFRMETHHIGKDEQDIHTVIITLLPIMESQTIQMKYIRKDNFYQAILSRATAYAEVDLSSGILQNCGGLWASYIKTGQKTTLQETVDGHLDDTVVKEDSDGCRRILDIVQLRKSFQEGQSTITHQFRRICRSSGYHWMELIIHIFQEQVTENMYALLYLKDIDADKRRQLAQEREASLDPLTGLFNRKTFELRASNYIMNLASEEELCVLILLDLDDFKQVNDTMGHQAGDDVLRAFASLIQQSFRSTDYVGRLGGDEFLVFVKDFRSKKSLNQRLRCLQSRLKKLRPIPASYSAGITIVPKKNYRYGESLRQADAALYVSKRESKSTFRYWEPSMEI